MDQQTKTKLLEKLGNQILKEHEVLTIGQQEFEAEFYREVSNPDELVKTVQIARELNIPVSIIGLGFSFDPSVTEIPGLVIKNNSQKFDILSVRGKIKDGQTEREQVFVSAESGVRLNQLVRYTLDEGLSGLESFLGSPGTLGDSLLINEKYEEDNEYLASHVFTIRVLTKENEVVEISGEPFLYPLAENQIKKKHVLPLSVIFQLTPGDKTDLWKKATKAAFERNQSDLLDPLKGNFQL